MKSTNLCICFPYFLLLIFLHNKNIEHFAWLIEQFLNLNLNKVLIKILCQMFTIFNFKQNPFYSISIYVFKLYSIKHPRPKVGLFENIFNQCLSIQQWKYQFMRLRGVTTIAGIWKFILLLTISHIRV